MDATRMTTITAAMVLLRFELRKFMRITSFHVIKNRFIIKPKFNNLNLDKKGL